MCADYVIFAELFLHFDFGTQSVTYEHFPEIS